MLQETEQLGIKGQDIPAELKQLPQQLPHLLQPLVDLLRSQPMSDAITYHTDFLQHVHRTAPDPGQPNDKAAGSEPSQSSTSTSASGCTFQAVQLLRSMEASPPASSTEQANSLGSADAGISHHSSPPQSSAESTTVGISPEGQTADADSSMHQAPDGSKDGGMSGLPAADDAGVAEIDWSAALEADADVGSAEGAEAEGLQGDIDWDIDLAGVEVLEDENTDSAEPGPSGEPGALNSTSVAFSIPAAFPISPPYCKHARSLSHASCLYHTRRLLCAWHHQLHAASRGTSHILRQAESVLP